MNDVLLFLTIEHDGDWNKIYKDITEKRPINKEDVEKVKNSIPNDCNYITILDNNYPSSLKSIYKPPFLLFYKGNLSLLSSSKKKVAVIGSRLYTDYGKKAAIEITKDLVKKDIIIVSGLAKGIDSIAHKTCLENKGSTIAILGNGLDVCYPKENAQLYDDIVNSGGLIISEYPLGSTPDKDHFPSRNRLIAGISDGIALMEAKNSSGSMNTVSHGLENGKFIFCVPAPFDLSSGCNYLIKQGAKLIENANDIIEDL